MPLGLVDLGALRRVFTGTTGYFRSSILDTEILVTEILVTRSRHA
ncbi:hypothetical protein [Tropheryma whipplei]|nr:hypothetical protein [Tropheryma whipplei]